MEVYIYLAFGGALVSASADCGSDVEFESTVPEI